MTLNIKALQTGIFRPLKGKLCRGAPSLTLPTPSTYFYCYFKKAPNNKLLTLSLTCSYQQVV